MRRLREKLSCVRHCRKRRSRLRYRRDFRLADRERTRLRLRNRRMLLAVFRLYTLNPFYKEIEGANPEHYHRADYRPGGNDSQNNGKHGTPF